MMHSREYLLDSEIASSLLRSSLTDVLALSLSSCVLSMLGLSTMSMKGSVFADRGLSTTELHNFSSGGKLTKNEFLNNWFVDNMVSNNQGFWIIEDWLAQPDDHFLTKMDLPFFVFGEEVYYIVENWKQEPYWPRLVSNRPPLFHAFYVAGIFPLKQKTLELEHLSCFAKNVLSVAIGVYDGESFVVCNREPDSNTM